jgi:hypothetical protein
MGTVTVSAEQVLAVVGAAAAIITAVWHAAMYIGKITVRVSRVEDRLDIHAERLESLSGKL